MLNRVIIIGIVAVFFIGRGLSLSVGPSLEPASLARVTGQRMFDFGVALLDKGSGPSRWQVTLLVGRLLVKAAWDR